MSGKSQTLDGLPIGQTGIVQNVGGEQPIARRLMEMGVLPGTPVETVRTAPLGDPLEIRIRGFLLSLRSAEAARITLGGKKSNGQEVGAPPQPFSPTVPEATPLARVRRVLVAGNPNSGKTTLFNALTGARARVSNYPGVTVTRLSRQITLPDGPQVELIDLPGTYSLGARSLEEQVAVDAVLGRHDSAPDAVIVVVDAGVALRSQCRGSLQFGCRQMHIDAVPVAARVRGLGLVEGRSAHGASARNDRRGGCRPVDGNRACRSTPRCFRMAVPGRAIEMAVRETGCQLARQ